ncbi:MAG: CYTH domain-containing protein [Eubacterium sp.]|nr:CYTH domain-containing protein [Eubacterium sp.]
MEIEKKYLILDLPRDLDQYPHEEIEQAYLCTNPTLRIRKKGGRYIFTFKNRSGHTSDQLCVAEEIETELDFDTYVHLFEKADGEPIRKTRYRIPYDNYTIELDVFHGKRKGLYLAEVEFPSIEEGEAFSPPAWFGEDVSGDVRYTNAYMATHSE